MVVAEEVAEEVLVEVAEEVVGEAEVEEVGTEMREIGTMAGGKMVGVKCISVKIKLFKLCF